MSRIIVVLGCVSCVEGKKSLEESGLDVDTTIYEHNSGNTACKDVEGNENSAFHHDLEAWTSTDGTNFQPLYTFQICADVPSIAYNGETVVVAFQAWVNREEDSQWDKVAVRISEDGGDTWGAVQFLTFDNLPEGAGRPFDPTMTYDSSQEKWRLYFSMGMTGNQLSDNVCTHSAISEDGIHFLYEENARFCAEEAPVIDPAVILYDGSWFYSAPKGAPQDGAHFLTSSDGLVFEPKPPIPSDIHHNWTGNFTQSEAGFRFYGGGSNPENDFLWWKETIDKGDSWSEYLYTNVPTGKDPGIGQSIDGTWLLIVPNK